MLNPYINITLNMLIMLNINSIYLVLACDLKCLLKEYVWVPRDPKKIHYHLKVWCQNDYLNHFERSLSY